MMMSKKTSKTIELKVNIQDYDLARKAKQAAKFRDKGLGVKVLLKLKPKYEARRTGDAMIVVNKFISMAEVPESKVTPMKWANTTLQTFLHP